LRYTVIAALGVSYLHMSPNPRHYKKNALMKTQIRSISAFIAALSVILVAGCNPPAEVPDATRKLKPDVSQGQVRVVLLRVGPVVSTNDRPTFVVTYGVEVPTEGAFSDLSFNSKDEIALVVHGKPLDYHELSSGAMGFDALPRQSELSKPAIQPGKAMIFQDTVFTGLVVDAKQLEVRLQFSWRGTPLRFSFENVPVGYRSAKPGL
jgi:hypothetical protein